MGLDFLLIYGGLRAFLTGQNPYAAPGYYSAPPFTVLFAPLGLLPFWLAFALLTIITLALFITAYRKRAAYWLAFVPVFYVLFVGNVDVLFVALAAFIKPNRRGALIAAFITVKPQLAILLLPFFLLTWLRENRRLLIWWLGFTAALWGIPARLFPAMTREWLTGVTSGAFGHSLGNSPGLWSLTFIPAPIILLLCAVVMWWGTHRDESAYRVVWTLVSPFGQWNGLAALVDTAPIPLLAPIGIAALYLSGQTGQAASWVMIPLAALGWQTRETWSEWLLTGIVRIYGAERVREALNGHA